MRIRLLPFFLVMIVALLTLRVGVVYKKGSDLIDRLYIEKSQALASSAPAEGGHEQKEGGHEKKKPEKKKQKQESKGIPHPAPAADAELDDGDLDFTSFTESELEVLQSLAERRDELKQKARELEQREALLDAFAQRVDAKLAEVQTIKKQIETTRAEVESLVSEFRNQEDSKYKSVISTYEKMKPKDAARIFNTLEMDVLLDIITGMKESKRAPIIAAMTSDKAKDLTNALANPRHLPDLANTTAN